MEKTNYNFISNPGCYATSILLPLFPLLNKKVIKKDGIIIDSKSGISGAGKQNLIENIATIPSKHTDIIIDDKIISETNPV